MKIACYFTPVPDVCIYKKRWITQWIHGIPKTDSSLYIVNRVEQCKIIFTVITDYEKIYLEHKKLIDLNHIKFIIISCQDTPFDNTAILDNDNILFVLDHCKNTTLKNTKIISLSNTQNRFVFREGVSLLKNREYDLVFFGKINLGNEYQDHRTQVIKKMKEFGLKYPQYKVKTGETVSLKEYYHYLLSSKILISPYGYGPWSLKDFEAVCTGTHVIKPNIYYECYPNYYANMDDYEDNLDRFDEIVLRTLQHIDETQQKVDKNREMFQQYNIQKQVKQLEMLIQSKFIM